MCGSRRLLEGERFICKIHGKKINEFGNLCLKG